MFALLLALSITGIATSHEVVCDPTVGPCVVTMSVYNNSSGTMAVGDVVIWDVDAITGDDDNYVNTTTTATATVAGVVYPSAISTKERGSIAIYGAVDVDILGSVIANDKICASGTAGEAATCAHTAAYFGTAQATGINTTVKAFINP